MDTAAETMQIEFDLDGIESSVGKTLKIPPYPMGWSCFEKDLKTTMEKIDQMLEELNPLIEDPTESIGKLRLWICGKPRHQLKMIMTTQTAIKLKARSCPQKEYTSMPIITQVKTIVTMKR